MTLTGCLQIQPQDAEVVLRLVDDIASYAGADAAMLCSLFSTDTFASVCFPGLPLDLPPAVRAELLDAICKLSPYMLTTSVTLSPAFTLKRSAK